MQKSVSVSLYKTTAQFTYSKLLVFGTKMTLWTLTQNCGGKIYFFYIPGINEQVNINFSHKYEMNRLVVQKLILVH
jgi:hypothetical protein